MKLRRRFLVLMMLVLAACGQSPKPEAVEPKAKNFAQQLYGANSAVGALAAGDFFTRITKSTTGGNPFGDSDFPVLSSDGRFVAFTSYSGLLIGDDTNNAQDIYVYDRIAQTLSRASVRSDGGQANNGVGQEGSGTISASISADGRFVAFSSFATNLVDGDTNLIPGRSIDSGADVFVRDMVAGNTTRVSVNSAGVEANGSSRNPSLSGDGRYVVFTSRAGNLASPDCDGCSVEFFLHDRNLQTTTRIIAASPNGDPGDFPVFSTDGRYIAFVYNPPVFGARAQIAVYEMANGSITLASVNSDEVIGNENSVFQRPAISSDGRFVAFSSSATNLVSGDTNGFDDVFVRDMVEGTTSRISISSTGAQGNQFSRTPSISNDGRYVTFASLANNLVAGDTNSETDIFIHDRLTGQTTRISETGAGAGGNSFSNRSSISGDGQQIAIASRASNLVSGDIAEGYVDIFLVERTPPDTTPPTVTLNQSSGQADPTNTNPIEFTATFSETVTGFTPSDVSITGTANLTNKQVTLSGSGPSYTISVSGIGGNGTVVASIPAGVVKDAANNDNTASTHTDNSVTFDTAPPTANPTQSPAANSGGWNNTDVSVTWNWADNPGGSGIDLSKCTSSSTSSGEGTLTLSATCQDALGNAATASRTVKVDKTKPTLSYSVTKANANPYTLGSWSNQNLILSFSCTDSGGSGIASDTVPDVTLSNEGASQSVTSSGVCTDYADNSANLIEVSNLNIDKTAPIIGASSSYAAGSWTNQNVSVHFDCSDTGGSTLANCPSDVVVSAEGITTSVPGTATDQAGNSTTISFGPIKIDRSVPTGVSGAPSTAPNAGGWYNQPLTIAFTSSDTSGAPITCTSPSYSGPDGNNITVSGSCTDQAGNTTPASITIKYDATPPVITGSRTPEANTHGWNNSDVTVSFTCTDHTSQIAAGYPVGGTVLNTETAVSGVSVSGSCQDNAGNSASTSVGPVKIDKTTPTLVFAGPSNTNWFSSNVSIPFTPGDTLSGLVPSSPTSPLVLSTEGSAVSGNISLTDLAGNSKTFTSPAYMIDKTAPVLSPSVTPNPATVGQPLSASAGASDSVSGIASQSCGTVSSSTAGNFSVTCTATNGAGLSTSASVSYLVNAPTGSVCNFEGFFQPVDNAPTVNSAKAGRAIPVKFSCGGNLGLDIFAAGYPGSQTISCSTNQLTDAIEETVTAGNSQLHYDAATNRYNYVWKTSNAWANTCRQLVLRFKDGTQKIALFNFTR